MKRNRYSKSRQRTIEKADESLLRSIRRLQNKLADLVRDAINDLERDGDTLKDSITNVNKISRLNRAYADLIAAEGKSIINPVLQGIDRVHDQNEKYFSSMTGKDISKPAERSKNRNFKSFGLELSGKVIAGGLIHSVLFDESPVNKVKSFIIGALKGKTKATQIINRFNTVIRGREKRGIFEQHILERMPAPFERFDRATGNILSTDLDLNFAIYQGGEISGTRPFCRLRNNQVFSRDEIARFGTPQDQYGGYTNKSQGEFQGKPDLYDPFTDLGGINCRHQLDWISDELAFTLRPDLRDV